MTDDAVPDSPDAPDAPDLRASDADRERVVEVLRDALADGRLDMAEFEERLEETYRARTYRELAPITRDLPAAGVVPPPVVPLHKEPARGGGPDGRIVGGGGSSWALGVMSGFQRKGRWTVPRRLNCVAFWGGGEIDLREADFSAGEVEITCVAVMGGMQIVVPPGVEVVVRGVGVMGGFDHRESGVPGDPGLPRVVVTGFAFWGGVGIERKKTRAARQQEKRDRRAARHEPHAALRDEAHDAHRPVLEGRHDLHHDLHHNLGLRPERQREERRERREGRDRQGDRDGRGGGERYVED